MTHPQKKSISFFEIPEKACIDENAVSCNIFNTNLTKDCRPNYLNVSTKCFCRIGTYMFRNTMTCLPCLPQCEGCLDGESCDESKCYHYSRFDGEK